MSHIPKKALIVYSPIKVDQPVPNVDQIAFKGCSGQIALESIPNQDSTKNALQLLGLYDKDNENLKEIYKERFNKMSLAILSNSIDTLKIAKQLECYHDNIKSVEQVKSLSNKDVVFVDFTDYPTHEIWTFVNQLFSNEDSISIQCVISPSSSLRIHKNKLFFLPEQSCQKKKGLTISISETQSLIYSYLHIGSGRNDSVTTYSEEEIKSKGSNGSILAYHLLGEVGHKLGFIPKYGA